MCADHSTNLILRLQNGGGPYMDGLAVIQALLTSNICPCLNPEGSKSNRSTLHRMDNL